jgi:hypothetical protein
MVNGIFLLSDYIGQVGLNASADAGPAGFMQRRVALRKCGNYTFAICYGSVIKIYPANWMDIFLYICVDKRPHYPHSQYPDSGDPYSLSLEFPIFNTL